MNVLPKFGPQRFARALLVVAAIAGTLLIAPVAVQADPVSSTFGATGPDPQGIAIDAAGNVYTLNNGDATLSRIAPAGVPTIAFGSPSPESPTGIAVDAAGNIYTANYGGSVTQFTPAGASSLFSSSPAPASLAGPNQIAIDAAGNVYIANYTPSYRVYKLTPTGSSSWLGTAGLSPPWPSRLTQRATSIPPTPATTA